MTGVSLCFCSTLFSRPKLPASSVLYCRHPDKQIGLPEPLLLLFPPTSPCFQEEILVKLSHNVSRVELGVGGGCI